MKAPVVLIGTGEMGGIFARGLLRSGHPVYPITRDIDPSRAAADYPAPLMVLVAVAEADLEPVLHELPAQWKDRLVLLQNELLPSTWQQHDIEQPTVISVWFEKKPGQDAKVLLPSPVFGPHAELILRALDRIGIPCRALDSEDELLFELVLKNLYILTTNIAGLRTGGTVGELWERHPHLTRALADEVIDIQAGLTGREFDREALLRGMQRTFEADPEHKCMGRSAPARLGRTVALADKMQLSVPILHSIATEQAGPRS
jgi:ketopantoate reductase